MSKSNVDYNSEKVTKTEVDKNEVSNKKDLSQTKFIPPDEINEFIRPK